MNNWYSKAVDKYVRQYVQQSINNYLFHMLLQSAIVKRILLYSNRSIGNAISWSVLGTITGGGGEQSH